MPRRRRSGSRACSDAAFPRACSGRAGPELGSSADVRRHLEVLSESELIVAERQEPEPEYAFKHSIIEEVAYESLAFATRELLHERVGEAVERASAGAA